MGAKWRMRLAVGIAAAAWLAPAHASALLIDKNDEPIYTVFYPYPTTFTLPDPGFAFDDDPLAALPSEPLAMPLPVYDVPASQSLVEPRMTFVEEMVESGDAI